MKTEYIVASVIGSLIAYWIIQQVRQQNAIQNFQQGVPVVTNTQPIDPLTYSY